MRVVEARTLFDVRHDQVPTLPADSRIQIGAEIYTLDEMITLEVSDKDVTDQLTVISPGSTAPLDDNQPAKR